MNTNRWKIAGLAVNNIHQRKKKKKKKEEEEEDSRRWMT